MHGALCRIAGTITPCGTGRPSATSRGPSGGCRATAVSSSQVVRSIEYVKLVDLVGLSLESDTGLPVIVLREREAPNRLLPIFIGGGEAVAIAVALGGVVPPRPLTHDLMADLVHALDAEVDRVEVTELRDGSFFAELAVNGPDGERRLDTRPSDAIALAVRLDVPVFVHESVLDEAGTVVSEDMVLDDDAIDEEVSRFRSLLDELDSAPFGPDVDSVSDTPSWWEAEHRQCESPQGDFTYEIDGGPPDPGLQPTAQPPSRPSGRIRSWLMRRKARR